MDYMSENSCKPGFERKVAVKSKLSDFGDVKPGVLDIIFDCKILSTFSHTSQASHDIEIVQFYNFILNLSTQAPNC